MRFVSTRDSKISASFSEAIVAGLCPDGGLYVPERLPRFKPESFDGLSTPGEIGAKLLEPFLEGEPLKAELAGICARAFSFPMPLVIQRDGPAVLELFHGPTAAFKDVGARFLAECLSRMDVAPFLVLVATSGDTGGAVAASFFRRTAVEVAVLFPKGRVSAIQEGQLTRWGENVRALAVLGDFDACQRMAKETFLDAAWQKRQRKRLVSANSINLGRLLPQTVYYAASSLEYLRRRGRPPAFVVPSGNLGNALAAYWAKEMGFPIRAVHLAFNANHSVTDYLATGTWHGHPTIPTLANAMDVGNPSNMERLLHLYSDLDRFRREVTARSVGDDRISEVLMRSRPKYGRDWCPHTAAAVAVFEELKPEDAILVATAHPGKFPAVDGAAAVPPPSQLAEILARPASHLEIEPATSALEEALARPLPGGLRSRR